MENSEETKKDKIFWAILNSALELEFKKGNLKWTLSELSRKSGVTRSLIYYYFGRSKVDLLKAAVTIIGDTFVGVHEERMKMWAEGRILDSLLEMRKMYTKVPYLGAYYLSTRGKPNEVGEALAQVERRYRNKLKKLFPAASTSQLNTLFAVFFGVAFSPFVGRDELEHFAKSIEGLLQKPK